MIRTAVELVNAAIGDGLCREGPDALHSGAEALDAEVAALRASNAELTRKGESLCQAYGSALIDIGVSASRVAGLEAELARLKAPRSPNALELAEQYRCAWLDSYGEQRMKPNDEIKRVEAALVAYDNR